MVETIALINERIVLSSTISPLLKNIFFKFSVSWTNEDFESKSILSLISTFSKILLFFSSINFFNSSSWSSISSFDKEVFLSSLISSLFINWLSAISSIFSSLTKLSSFWFNTSNSLLLIILKSGALSKKLTIVSSLFFLLLK